MKQNKNQTYLPRNLIQKFAILCLLLGNMSALSAQAQDVSVIHSNPDLFPSLGPMMARTTVIEFADFQCPFCAMTTNLPGWLDRYEAQYGVMFGSAEYVQSLAEQGSIRFIFVPLHFLNNGRSLESTWATQAAFCAQDQDQFWKMHHAIFAASDDPTENNGKYSKDNLKRIAASIDGIDTVTFNACLDNDETLEKSQEVMNTFFDAGFQLSTPQFWVNERQVDATVDALRRAIEGQ